MSDRALLSRTATQPIWSGQSETVSKRDFILRECRGRRVLDIGCIDHSAATAVALGERWLHHEITAQAESVVGIDYLAADAEALRLRGYNIVSANAEDLDLGEQFDVLVAGDLVEHLLNVGRFLASCRRHMRRDSRLILTTPNPFNIEQVGHVLRSGAPKVNAEHVAWIDPVTMRQLAERCGFKIVSFAWLDTDYAFDFSKRSIRGRIANTAVRIAHRRYPALRRDFGVVLQLT
ncbi:MAG: class I SAM-dependent methyltransferase [Acidimicrobiia bacterium]